MYGKAANKIMSLMPSASSHSQTEQVVWDNLGERLENLELVTPGLRPEHKVRFDGWAARIGTREFRNHDGVVVGKIEMLARPGTNAFLLGRNASGLLGQPKIEQETQRLERLMVGVRAFFADCVTIV